MVWFSSQSSCVLVWDWILQTPHHLPLWFAAKAFAITNQWPSAPLQGRIKVCKVVCVCVNSKKNAAEKREHSAKGRKQLRVQAQASEAEGRLYPWEVWGRAWAAEQPTASGQYRNPACTLEQEVWEIREQQQKQQAYIISIISIISTPCAIQHQCSRWQSGILPLRAACAQRVDDPDRPDSGQDLQERCALLWPQWVPLPPNAPPAYSVFSLVYSPHLLLLLLHVLWIPSIPSTLQPTNTLFSVLLCSPPEGQPHVLEVPQRKQLTLLYLPDCILNCIWSYLLPSETDHQGTRPILLTIPS